MAVHVEEAVRSVVAVVAAAEAAAVAAVSLVAVHSAAAKAVVVEVAEEVVDHLVAAGLISPVPVRVALFSGAARSSEAPHPAGLSSLVEVPEAPRGAA